MTRNSGKEIRKGNNELRTHWNRILRDNLFEYAKLIITRTVIRGPQHKDILKPRLVFAF